MKKPFYQSRKFLLLCLDVAVSLAIYLVPQLLGAESAEVALTVIGIIQPVFVAVIIGIAVEDSAALKAGSHPSQG
jgi:hypothetical protein